MITFEKSPRPKILTRFLCPINENRVDRYLLRSLVMYEFMTFRAVELLSAKFRIRGRKINGADQPSEAKSTPP